MRTAAYMVDAAGAGMCQGTFFVLIETGVELYGLQKFNEHERIT